MGKALWTKVYPEQLKGPHKGERKRVKPISDKRRSQMRDYARIRKEFLGTRKICEVKGCDKTAREVHHMRGRAGALYLNTQHWLAVCSDCHHWITDNPGEAREEGLICDRGDWGKQ